MNKMQYIRRWFRQESPSLKFAALQFSFWAVMAIGNYQNVFLQERGFNASTLGMVNAVLSAVSIVATPIWGMFSDRIHSIRKVFQITLLFGSVLFGFIPMLVGLPFMSTPLLLCALPVIYFFRNPCGSMLDNWQVRYCNQKRLSYGFIRAFGSLGFTICGLSITGLIASKGTSWTFPVCSILMMAVLAITFFIDDVKPLSIPAAEPQKQKEKLNPLDLFKEYYYVTFLVFVFLLWLSCNCIMPFIPYLLNELGIASSRFGVVNSYVALLEIPMLIAAQPLRRWVPLHILALAGGVCYILTGILLGLCAESLVAVIIIETFHGLGSGLLIASCANYVFNLVPENLKATGQSLYVAAASLAGIVGNLAGGAIIDALGARAFYCILSCTSVIAVAFLGGTLLFGTKVLKRKIPTY